MNRAIILGSLLLLVAPCVSWAQVYRFEPGTPKGDLYRVRAIEDKTARKQRLKEFGPAGIDVAIQILEDCIQFRSTSGAAEACDILMELVELFPGELPESKMKHAFAMLLAADWDGGRAWAAGLLAEVNATEYIPQLLIMIDDPGPRARRMAVEALGMLGDAKVLEQLRRRAQVAKADPHAASSAGVPIESTERAIRRIEKHLKSRALPK